METLPVEILPPPLTELIASLEKATLMAKQLPNTIEQTQIFQIYSSLQNTQNQLTSFLFNFNSSHPQQPHLLQQPPQLENSVSSAIGGGGGDDEVEPMQVGEDEEEDSEFIIDKVEERMKNCVIHSNKRRKRNLSSPSSIQGFDQRIYYNDTICNSNTTTTNNGVVLVQGFEDEFDPQATRLRSLELIYQFHA
ncbi:uncharacterized protein LOC113306353 [Papaver somniferum]|uniref:uncharacterized protein LOC113306353 n=1 Tax=Papaver somniferum TaxID=3469 RepID=UPI000E6F8EA3|nr:uncharacterized protein LOC113306353 [Papaver somniferum]